MGKANFRTTQMERTKRFKSAEKVLFALDRASAGGISQAIGISGSASSGSGGGTTVAYLKTAGDTMIGPISFYRALQAIASGVLDVSVGSLGYSSRVVVSPETGVSDDLVTISGASHDGQFLIIQVFTGDTITLKTTGNIKTTTGSDYVISNDSIILYFESGLNKWVQLTGGTGGGSGANTALSNLSAVAINTALLSNGNGTLDFGSGSNYWLNGYFDRVRFSFASRLTNDYGIQGIDSNLDNITDGIAINVKNSGDTIRFSQNGVDFTVFKNSLLDFQSTLMNNVKFGNDVNANQNRISSLKAIQFTSSGSFIGGTNAILTSINRLIFSHLATDVISLEEVATQYATFSKDSIDFSINSNNILQTRELRVRNRDFRIEEPTSSRHLKLTKDATSHYGLYNLVDTGTNIGHAFLINGVDVIDFVHNTAFTPNNFLYSFVPLLMNNEFIQFDTMSSPTAPSAGSARLYVKNNFSGKTQLLVRFNTGAEQVIATQP